MPRIVSSLIALILGMLAVNLKAGQPSPTISDWVVLDSGDPAGELGWSVDISGNLAIVGAPFYNGGHAFIFDVNSGQLLHRLAASGPTPSDLFGFSVAIDDGLAVVAEGQDNAAYIFDVNTGQQLHKLTPVSNPNHFVRTVDISDGIAVLGVPQVTGRFSRPAGAAFVYDALSGSLLHRINNTSDEFAKQSFGSRVDIEGRTLAITSPSVLAERDDVQVFDAVTGQLQWSYGYETTGQRLGIMDLAIDDGFVVVGAGALAPSFDMSTAIVFDRDSGAELHRIDTHVPNLNDRYKRQLDVSGNRLVVGSWGTFHEGHGYYVGDVHIFDVMSGDYLVSVANPFPTSFDDFGFSVAIEGRRLIVGATGVGSLRGRAYSFLLVPEPATILILLMGALAAVPRRFCRGPA
jgi:outer membrane protein assembly factor BamB